MGGRGGQRIDHSWNHQEYGALAEHEGSNRDRLCKSHTNKGKATRKVKGRRESWALIEAMQAVLIGSQIGFVSFVARDGQQNGGVMEKRGSSICGGKREEGGVLGIRDGRNDGDESSCLTTYGRGGGGSGGGDGRQCGDAPPR